MAGELDADVVLPDDVLREEVHRDVFHPMEFWQQEEVDLRLERVNDLTNLNNQNDEQAALEHQHQIGIRIRFNEDWERIVGNMATRSRLQPEAAERQRVGSEDQLRNDIRVRFHEYWIELWQIWLLVKVLRLKLLDKMAIEEDVDRDSEVEEGIER